MKFGLFFFCFVFLEKEVWKCWIWVTLDKGQWMTLTVSSIVMYSFIWLHVPIFTSQASIISGYLQLNHFPIKSNSNQGHQLNKISRTRVTNAADKVSRSSAFTVPDKTVLIIYGHGIHVGHVTWTVCIYLCSPTPLRFQMKFGFNRFSGF